MRRLLLHLTALLLTFALGYSLTWTWEAARYYIKWELHPARVIRITNCLLGSVYISAQPNKCADKTQKAQVVL